MGSLKKVIFPIILIIAILLLYSVTNTSFIHAASSAPSNKVSYDGSGKNHGSGYFWIVIYDEETGTYANAKISVDEKSSHVTFKDLLKSPHGTQTSWTISVAKSGSYNLSLGNGSSSITVKTSYDVNDQYLILKIPFSFTIPSHRIYGSNWCYTNHLDYYHTNRFDFSGEAREKSGANSTVNDAISNSSSANGHSEQAHTVTGCTAYVNLSECGAITANNKHRYLGNQMGFTIERPTMRILGNYYVSGFTKNDLSNGSSRLELNDNVTIASAQKCCTSLDLQSVLNSCAVPSGYTYDSGNSTSLSSIEYTGYPTTRIIVFYKPLEYNISYQMNGGKNAASNPSSYTVCNPVTFSEPTRDGYYFAGWYIGDKKVDGINNGFRNNSLTSSNFVSSMAARTTGNLTVEAKWISTNTAPTIAAPVVSDKDSNDIAPFIKAIDGTDTLILQKGDKFTPLYYQTASDKEDGSLSDKTEVVKNTVDTSKAGTYNVIYKVTDSMGDSTTKSINVLVNDSPVLTAKDRTFFVGETVSKSDILSGVTAKDSEDGDIPSSNLEILSVNGDESIKSIDTKSVNHYIVKCKCTDSMKASSNISFKVSVTENTFEDMLSSYPRFIDKDSLSSLNPNSIWVVNSDYSNALHQSLYNDTPITSYTIEK